MEIKSNTKVGELVRENFISARIPESKNIDFCCGGNIPLDGCNTFHVTYKTLEEFERDLHRHIQLENNVLFPKAIMLEKTIVEYP